MSTREIARGGLLAAAATAWLYFGGVMPQIGPAACLIAGAASAIPLLRRANVKTAVLLYLVTSVLGLLLTPRKLIAAAYVLLFGLYREISDRVPSAGLHAAERQAGVF